MNPQEKLAAAAQRAQQLKNQEITRQKKKMNSSVSADELANPPSDVNPPVPQVNTNDGSRLQGMINNVSTNTQGFIEAQSAEAQKAKELATLLGTSDVNGAEQRSQLETQYGLPGNLDRLKDIQLQLAKSNEKTALARAQATEGGAGAVQAQRAIDITQKQAAIRDAGLAAESAVLQGNIETARTLIKDAMNDYYQDRQLNNQNIINQLNYYKSVADSQTQQLINREQRKYEEDQRQIEYVKSSVDAALKAGASPAEINQLISPETTDAEKLALAQRIVGARAFESVESERAYSRIRNASAALEYNNALNTLNGDNVSLTEKQRKEIASMPESKKVQSIITLNKNLTELKDLYDKYGTWNPINREAAKEISSLRSQLEIDIAVAGGQGAISEQEADRYTNIIGGKFFEKGSSAVSSINSILKTNDQKISDNINYVEAAIPGARVFEPFQTYITQKQAEDYISEQLSQQQDNIDSYLQSFQTVSSTASIKK